MGEMTKGEAIKYGTEWLKDEYLDAKDRAFIKIALEVLEQEPSGDLISREDTLTAFADYVGRGMSMNDYEALWDIVAKMPSVKQEPRWIPVSEGLPKKEMNCLVTDSLGNVHKVTFYHALDGREFYFSGCYCVRAWMPLPKPYEESEEV